MSHNLLKRKRLIIRAVLIIIIVFLAVFYLISTSLRGAEIAFLDVGQGDSTLIKLPNNKLVLIDGGPDNIIIRRLSENLPFYKRKIDLVILSHFHDDHLIGLLEIIRRYQVDTIIYMKGSEAFALGKLFLQEARNKKINLLALESEANIDYGSNCKLKLLNPMILGIKKDDNNSLITRLSCGLTAALFSGDNNIKIEEALINTGQNWTANIFKASHHGSKTANSEAFLRYVRPSLFIISVGADNRFSHPSPEIIERINSLGIKIKRTDLDKTIHEFIRGN